MESAPDAQPAATSAMIRVVRREPALVTTNLSGLTLLETSPIGFAGAAEEDRRRWLNAFRRMLDGLDAPLQVVIDVVPGPDEETITSIGSPLDLDEMRGADMEYAAALRRAPTAHCITTGLGIAEKNAAPVMAPPTEMGIRSHTPAPPH